MQTWFLPIAVVVVSLGSTPAWAQAAGDGRDADRAAIRAHIEKISQAFLDGDIATIHATHTEDWRGFLAGSRTPLKGIEAYMRGNGFPWPPPTSAAPRPQPARDPNRAFQVSDFDAHFYTDDIAVASFLIDFGRRVDGVFTTGTRYRIMDIYVRRNGHWIQAASHTVVDPTWRNEQITQPAVLPPAIRQQLLDTRDAVWRAFFTNDQAALARLVPADTVVLQANPATPILRQTDIFEGARQQAARGLKLARLEFPTTEIQVYGPTAIIYTTYEYDLEAADGQRQTTRGVATEVFVRRGNAWVNPGWHLTPLGR